MIFENRTTAGRQLAERLEAYANRNDVLVLGVARGGVPVAYEVAEALGAPLDVFILRKLGVPGHDELAFGAIASGGARFVDQRIAKLMSVSPQDIRWVEEREKKELERRERLYRAGQPALNLKGRTVILVDDGIATGASMRAAIQALRQMNPARLVLAVPVAPESTCEVLRAEVDDLICVSTPEDFVAIGQFYRDFSQVSDEEVTELLDAAAWASMKRAS